MRYIIVGCGNIGKKRQRLLKEKCIAIVDPFFNGAEYKNFQEVPIDIYDAAIIATPNNCKIDILKYLLTNRKHVLIEKPLLLKNEQDADELRLIADRNSAIWYTSYNHRFEPLIKKLKEFLENDAVGKPYFVNFVYGNGTVQNIMNTWRDSGSGVLEDLGCHLIDLVSYLFPDPMREYKIIGMKNFEAKASDYCSFSTIDGCFRFLCSSLMWKNTFRIEVFGSKGSLHLEGLHKWGESRLIYRERIFPSGIPRETIITSSGEDTTWDEDITYFEKKVVVKESSYENDILIIRWIESMSLERKTG